MLKPEPETNDSLIMQWWGSYKLPMLVGLALLIVGVGGFYGYDWYQGKQAASGPGKPVETANGPGPDAKVPASTQNIVAIAPDGQVIDSETAAPETPTPAPTPAPGVPAINVLIAGEGTIISFGLNADAGTSSRSVLVELDAQNLNLADCRLIDEIVLDDATFTRQTKEWSAETSQKLQLVDGLHSFTARCLNNTVVSPTRIVRILDHQPKACKDYAFSGGDVTAATLQELRFGLVGTWTGCVSTPWSPAYAVTFVFNSNGTYQVWSDEIMDGENMTGSYYGVEIPSVDSTYEIDVISDSQGFGHLDIAFDSGSVTRGSLNHVRLMGNKLSFDFMHRNQYGPVAYQLTRQ